MQIARIVVGLSWIYHGLFPKLVHVAPIELAMTASIGFSDELSYFITKAAGVSEIIFGLVFITFYKIKSIIYLNITGLALLLMFVIIQMPNLLIEAFNPVTTNIPIIALSFILLSGINEQDENA